MNTEPKTTCPACGSEDLTQGFLGTGPYGGAVKFFEKSKFYKVTGRDVIQGRRCNQCGDVRFFVGIPKSSAAKST
jgi:hypothetical protein